MENIMPTHQEIGGMSDEELLQRMVTSHPERYGEAFWEFFTAQVYARVPAHPVVLDGGYFCVTLRHVIPQQLCTGMILPQP